LSPPHAPLTTKVTVATTAAEARPAILESFSYRIYRDSSWPPVIRNRGFDSKPCKKDFTLHIDFNRILAVVFKAWDSGESRNAKKSS
jgi:hypothetical protein